MLVERRDAGGKNRKSRIAHAWLGPRVGRGPDRGIRVHSNTARHRLPGIGDGASGVGHLCVCPHLRVCPSSCVPVHSYLVPHFLGNRGTIDAAPASPPARATTTGTALSSSFSPDEPVGRVILPVHGRGSRRMFITRRPCPGAPSIRVGGGTLISRTLPRRLAPTNALRRPGSPGLPSRRWFR